MLNNTGTPQLHNSDSLVWLGTEQEPELTKELCEDWRDDVYPKPEETYEHLEACEDWPDLQEMWLWEK